MSRMRTALRRGALMATVLAAVLAIGVQAASANETVAAGKAATWLSGQLTGGNHYLTYFHKFGEPATIESYEDVGLTIDGNFAFLAATAETGTSYKTQAKATQKWIQEHAAGYEGGGTCGGAGEVYAGSVAKIAVFQLANALSAKKSVETLECLEKASKETGRISNQGGEEDFSNPFSQGLAIIALEEKGTKEAAKKAAEYLLSQQCTGTEAGAFLSFFGSAHPSCNAGEPEVDATAMAVEALITAGKLGAAVEGMEWLEAHAEPESPGVYWKNTACTGSPEKSTNSTALATLNVAEPMISEGQAWLAAQQGSEGWLEGCSDPNSQVLGSNRVRATTQGVLGLLYFYYLKLATGLYHP